MIFGTSTFRSKAKFIILLLVSIFATNIVPANLSTPFLPASKDAPIVATIKVVEYVDGRAKAIILEIIKGKKDTKEFIYLEKKLNEKCEYIVLLKEDCSLYDGSVNEDVIGMVSCGTVNTMELKNGYAYGYYDMREKKALSGSIHEVEFHDNSTTFLMSDAWEMITVVPYSQLKKEIRKLSKN